MLNFEKRGVPRPYIAESWLQARWFKYYISLSTGLTSVIPTVSLVSIFICDLSVYVPIVCLQNTPSYVQHTAFPLRSFTKFVNLAC